MAYSSAEVKSGFFITASLAVLLTLTFTVGKFTSGKTKVQEIQFAYVSGLADNAPVYFGGREIGKVDKVAVHSDQDRPVLVTLRIPVGIRLHEGTQAFVDTLGLMGEKFVELSPGPVNSPFLAEGAVIQGTDPVPMYLLVRKMNTLADRMDTMTESLNPMMGRLNTLLAGHQEEISKTIANFHEISANLRDMTAELKTHPWKLVRKG